jgi:hypothetical protein
MMNNPIAETRERVPQTLSEEVQEKLKEIFAWLQKDVLTVKFRQPSHEFTFGVGITFVSYSLVLTPVV